MEPDRKAALRASALDARRHLPPADRVAGSAAAVDHLLTLPELRTARCVLLYAALTDEIDPSGVATRLGGAVRALFPRVRDDHLDLVAVDDVRAFRLGFRGIREPTGVPIDPEQVDVAVVPGVAFDLHGGRLGQGGGHYDRLLPRLRHDALRIGVAFACQVVPRIPREPHDEPVDVVVSERSVHRTGARVP